MCNGTEGGGGGGVAVWGVKTNCEKLRGNWGKIAGKLRKIAGKLRKIGAKMRHCKQPSVTLKVQHLWTSGSNLF